MTTSFYFLTYKTIMDIWEIIIHLGEIKMEFLLKALMTLVATGMVCHKEMREIYTEIKMNREEE